MTITVELIKKLRDETGGGVMDAKSALENAKGDYEKAKKALFEKGIASAGKRVGNDTGAGAIASYIHSDGKIGAIVDIRCETDFVARTEDFQKLGRDIAMQVVAMAPEYVEKSKVPDDKTDEADGLILLEQPFIRDASLTIAEVIKELMGKVGENIVVNDFHRLSLGNR